MVNAQGIAFVIAHEHEQAIQRHRRGGVGSALVAAFVGRENLHRGGARDGFNDVGHLHRKAGKNSCGVRGQRIACGNGHIEQGVGLIVQVHTGLQRQRVDAAGQHRQLKQLGIVAKQGHAVVTPHGPQQGDQGIRGFRRRGAVFSHGGAERGHAD